MNTIYSYYADVPELKRFDEIKLSLLWRERWAKAKLTPIILSEYDARKHPYFAEFDAAISKLPTVNPAPYERACYLRWLALAQAGGGIMSDLDVFPNVTPAAASVGMERDKIFIGQRPCCPCFVYASGVSALRLCQEFAKGLGDQPQDGRSHYSDQYSVESLVKAGADWITVGDAVRHYSDDGWESAPLLHFPNAVMGAKGLTPKWKHIPKLLPL